MNPRIAVCDCCKTEYVAVREHARFCSDLCRVRFHRRKKTTDNLTKIDSLRAELESRRASNA